MATPPPDDGPEFPEIFESCLQNYIEAIIIAGVCVCLILLYIFC